MSYKWCAVPQCTNTSIKTPEKLFICVPKNFKMRQKWLELSRRNCLEIKPSSNVYFCEDHFNLEKDMANYYQYKMGLSKRIIMVDKVLPSKFSCQEDCNKRLGDAGTSKSVVAKKLKRNLVKGRKNTLQQPIISKKLCFARAEQTLSNDQSTYTVHEPHTMGLPLYVDFRCKVCLKDIIGLRYSCLQCADWNMCASCEARGEHPEHYVLRLPAPKPDAEIEAVLKEIRKHIEDLLRIKNEINEIIVKQEVVQVKEEFEIDIEESILEMNNESDADVYVCQDSIPVNMTTPTDNAFRHIFPTKEREKNEVTESVTILQNIKKEPKDKSLFSENTLSDIHEKDYCENDVTT